MDRRTTQLGQGHARRAHARFAYRSMGQQRTFAEHDAPLEPFGSVVDARQHRGHDQQFARAAHQKAFIGTMRDTPPVARIQHGHAQPSAMAALQLGQPCQCVAAGAGGQRWHRPKEHGRCTEQGALQEISTIHRFTGGLARKWLGAIGASPILVALGDFLQRTIWPCRGNGTAR
jgi:hypothetical protein